MSPAVTALKPRKSPVQARSAATFDALHTAAIQVLTKEGLTHATTTRIAARAGMSVGSLYQYYPHRDALLAAVLEKHLAGVAAAVELACTEHRGQPVAQMAAGLVTGFLAVKLRDPAESKALYAVAAERGGAELAARGRTRMVTAIAAMLATAPDADFEDAATTSMIIFGAISGPVRSLLEGHTPPGFEASLKDELIRLVSSYLNAHRSAPIPSRAG